VLELPDGGKHRVALVVGDVVGRGPAAGRGDGPAAQRAGRQPGQRPDPGGALEQLDLFARRVRGARASTVVCAVLDLDTGELCYACAGHPPPMVVSGDGGVRLLTAGRGTPLGVVGRPPFVEAGDRLDPGSSILLCSDGLFERRDEVVDDGINRLAEVLGGLSGLPGDVADTLLDRMVAGRSAPDDVAFVLARMLPAALRMRLPADPRQLGVLRRAVARWCAEQGTGEDALTDLQLALGEAATNAIEHAYLHGDAAHVQVDLERTATGELDVRVGDAGRWRPPPADPGFRGRGLALIRDLTTDVVVEPGPEGTTVRFRMPAVPAPPPAAPGPPVAGPPAAPVAGPVPVGASVRRLDGPDGVRWQVAGDLDLVGVADVRGELLAELDRAATLTLVLAGDCWVSSAGVALLAELAQRAGRPLRVITPVGSPARRMLALAGLDRVLRGG
jgi:anti-sigma regulatory factor (Ser/Thr protein kinase)